MNLVTRTIFQIGRVLCQSGRDCMPPSPIRVYLNRGELAVGGKVVRIDAPDFPAFVDGGDYVLLLQRRGSHYMPSEGAGEIRNGRVYYRTGGWRGVNSGITLEDLARQIAMDAPAGSCDDALP